MENSQETNSDGQAVADLEAQVASLKIEAAKYRTERNTALRRAHAQGQVLAAHKIDHTIDDKDLESLEIESGQVKGVYEYTAPAPAKVEPPQPSQSGQLTIADIRNMSVDEINRDWENVSKVIETQGAM